MSWCSIAVLLVGHVPGFAQPPAPLRESVRIVLLQEDAQPLGRAVKVHLFTRTGEAPETVGGRLTDGTGTLTLGAVPPGRYDVWLEPGNPETAAALFRGHDVTAGEGPQTLSLKLPAAGRVTGRLLLADGRTPATGQIVAVQSGTVPADGADSAGFARGALTCYAEMAVGADGSFVLSGLTPGLHALDIRRVGEARPWCTVEEVKVQPGETTPLGEVILAGAPWQHLFDGKTLTGWREGDFYGKQPLRIEGDWIEMPMGDDMTGVTWAGEIPRLDYEVSLQAKRVSGSDFFCGLTFPVGETYCSLILGGWGGSVVGLSSLDYADASQNETTRWIQFASERWYRVRVRVTESRIRAWLDGERIVDADITKRKVSTRIEVEPSKPFGISTWRTTGAARDLRLRTLGLGEK